MRVLLVVPTLRYKYEYPSFQSNTDFPTAFAYLASFLRKAGHEVFGLNLNNDSGFRSALEMMRERLRSAIHEFQPQLIAVGGLCTDFSFLRDAIGIIRKLAPDVPIVCGGGIINNDTEFIFKLLKPDFCIIGEGEEILGQLADLIESGSQDYDQVPNLGYWKEGSPKFTKQDFNYPDLNTRPFPDYEIFGIKDMLDKYAMAARYLYRYTRPNFRPMAIVTARGCPFSCSFCVHQKGPRYRMRSIENIMQEIASMHERYHFNVLMIMDELFAVNKARMHEFCSGVLKGRKELGWDFDWLFQTHASASLDRDTLELAKQAGCYCFSYGLESASPRVLASMNKKTKPSQIIQTKALADSVGIGFSGNLIFGDIAETQETVQESMDFFMRYGQEGHFYPGFIQPYPGSKLFEDCFKKGIFPDKVKFYEHIDESIWNMTAMPDRVWLPWLYLLYYFSASFPWTKAAEALRCTEEQEGENNLPAALPGRRIYRIWAKCPYCLKEVYYREMLGTLKQKTSLIAKIGAVLTNKLTWLKLKLGVKNLFLYTLSFRHPLFKLLKVAMRERSAAAVFFVTGCPHCHKRIKINLPARGWASRIQLFIKKLIFKSVFLFSPR